MKPLATELVTIHSKQIDGTYTVCAVLKSPVAPGLDRMVTLATAFHMADRDAAWAKAEPHVETLRAWLRDLGVAE